MGIIHGGNVIGGGNVNATIERTTIAGDTAGTHTVPGVGASDTLVSVVRVTAAGVHSVLTSEFSIDSANTLDNTSGTDTSDDILHIEWIQA